MKDFPASALQPYGIEALSPDRFLVGLLPDWQKLIIESLAIQRRRLKNPPHTPSQFLDALQRQRLTQFVAALRPFESQL